MRPKIEKLIAFGPFPAEEDVDLDRMQLQLDAIGEIPMPITDEEAAELVKLFGPDEYFGMAWNLVHLIESAPGWPIEACIASGGQEEWMGTLRERAKM